MGGRLAGGGPAPAGRGPDRGAALAGRQARASRAAGQELADRAILQLRVDLVCGFPVPVARRPELGESLFELVQRREEAAAAATSERWTAALRRGSRVIAPNPGMWAEWSGSDGAELGVEYPMPWSRNGELAAAVIDYGREVARRALAARRG